MATALGAIASAMLAVRASLAEAATRAQRDRALQARDHALGAAQILLNADSELINLEEMRPYRKGLIAAGLRESQTLVRDMEGDPRAESQLIDAYLSLSSVEREGGERGAERCSRPGRRWRWPRSDSPTNPVPYFIKKKKPEHFITSRLRAPAPRSASPPRGALPSSIDYFAHRPPLAIAGAGRCRSRNQFNTGNSLTSMSRFPAAIEAFLEAGGVRRARSHGRSLSRNPRSHGEKSALSLPSVPRHRAF